PRAIDVVSDLRAVSRGSYAQLPARAPVARFVPARGDDQLPIAFRPGRVFRSRRSGATGDATSGSSEAKGTATVQARFAVDLPYCAHAGQRYRGSAVFDREPCAQKDFPSYDPEQAKVHRQK